MHQAVQNGIGDGGIARVGVPLIQGLLIGHGGRFHTDAIIENLQQICAFVGPRGGESPVIEHDQVGARQCGEFAREAAIGVSDAQFLE